MQSGTAKAVPLCVFFSAGCFDFLIRFVFPKGAQTICNHLLLPDWLILLFDHKAGEQLGPAYDFEDCREKVNRYVNEHGDTLAIHLKTDSKTQYGNFFAIA